MRRAPPCLTARTPPPGITESRAWALPRRRKQRCVPIAATAPRAPAYAAQPHCRSPLFLYARAPAQVRSRMARIALVCAFAASAAGTAVDLTPDNFDKEVLQSGKAAFIKFLAPW